MELYNKEYFVNIISLQSLNLNSNLLSLSNIVSLVALGLSLIALLINFKISQRNTRLSIQQLLFKTALEKSKDCNLLWEKEPVTMDVSSTPRIIIISEIIISMEIIEKSLEIFEKNYHRIRRENESDFYFIFWKQLRTDLREWIRKTPQIAKNFNNSTYSQQIKDIFKKFEVNFE